MGGWVGKKWPECKIIGKKVREMELVYPKPNTFCECKLIMGAYARS